MPPGQRSMRTNLLDYKTKFIKLLGPVKELQYVQLLQSFMNFKLSKAELDLQVRSTIGKENVSLHNQFIRAIFANAICSEAPPPPSTFVHDISKPVKGIRRKPLAASLANEDSSSGLSIPPVRLNGEGAIPSSPKKGRSAARKPKERPSPLGFHQRIEVSASQGGSADEDTPRSLENGGLRTPDVARAGQQSQYATEHSNLELSSPILPAAKRPRLGLLGTGFSGDVKVETGFLSSDVKMEEAEEEKYDAGPSEDDIIGMPDGLIRPPLGCIVSHGGPIVERFVSKFPPQCLTYTLLGERIEDDFLDGDYLPDAGRLHKTMQLIAVERGLEDVSESSAVCLNEALNVYLKAIIQPVVELARARRSRDEGSRDTRTNLKDSDPNCVRDRRRGSSAHTPKQSDVSWRDVSFFPLEGQSEEQGRQAGPISCHDLKIAMDMNPKLLGEDFPTHLERISLRAFDVNNT